MSSRERFPQRVFLKGYDNGKLSNEASIVQQEMTSRGIPCLVYTTEDFLRLTASEITRQDLIVGDFMWIRHALFVLGISMPRNIDYPQCLQHLLYRRVWQSTLGEVQSQLLSNPEGVFIKPVEDCKAFSGLIASLDWMSYLLDQFPASFSVYCSELVSMLAEYRVYVLNGRVLSICQYQGPTDMQIDVQIVEQAVKTLFESEEGKAISGCAMDFAVMRVKENDGSERPVTGLVEVNEGFAIGIYEGVSAKDYTDMLVERWLHLVS